MTSVPLMSAVLCAAAPVQAAPACPPLAAIEGPDEALVSRVASGVSNAGIELVDPEEEAQWRCPRLRVFVSEGAGRIHVEAIDGVGRALSRAVASEDTAAVLIESWVSAEYGSPRQPAGEGAELELVVRPEASVANDAAWMGGVALGVCMRVRGFCLDFDMRTGFGRLGASDLQPSASRFELGLSAGISDAIAAGPVDLFGGLAIGARWLHTATDTGARCSVGERCPLIDFVERLALEVDTLHPAIELALGVRLPMDEMFALEARAAAQLMPAGTAGAGDGSVTVSDGNLYVIRIGAGARWGM